MTPDTDTDGPRTAQLAEEIVNAIQFPDERVHFIRMALQFIPDDHPDADDIEATLEQAESSALAGTGASIDYLRAAYGSIPVGPEDVESTASGRESERDTYATVQSEARKVLQALTLVESVDRDRIDEDAANAVWNAAESLANAAEPLAYQLVGLDDPAA